MDEPANPDDRVPEFEGVWLERRPGFVPVVSPSEDGWRITYVPEPARL